ncbi:hypothetical protein HDV62DRAFT_55807 [Trichoderma sp. SZMC 28011]
MCRIYSVQSGTFNCVLVLGLVLPDITGNDCTYRPGLQDLILRYLEGVAPDHLLMYSYCRCNVLDLPKQVVHVLNANVSIDLEWHLERVAALNIAIGTSSLYYRYRVHRHAPQLTSTHQNLSSLTQSQPLYHGMRLFTAPCIAT